jgi:hypothetical protein
MRERDLDTTLKLPATRRRTIGVIVAGLSTAFGIAASGNQTAARGGKNRRHKSHSENSSNATSIGVGGAGGKGGDGGDAHIPCIPGFC